MSFEVVTYTSTLELSLILGGYGATVSLYRGCIYKLAGVTFNSYPYTRSLKKSMSNLIYFYEL